MKTNRLCLVAMVSTVCGMFMTSCNDSESYADLLRDERIVCNAYLAQYRIENSVPADTVFEIGEDAPYYRIDDEGNLYMQVLNAGDPDDRAQYDDLIYFRFMRMSITDWYDDPDSETWSGNADDMSMSATNFRYQNFSLSTTSQYGTGIQYPLVFLGIGCHVNILIKSQYGFTDEIAYVTPFVYNIRYFRPQT